MTFTRSPSETQRFAAELAVTAKAGDVFCLCGPLGAGKTAFAQGFARGLGVTEPVTSPTFTLMQTYTSGRLPLYHFDLYRTEGVINLDFEDYLYGDGICLIEWAQFARERIFGAVWVTLTPVDGGDSNDGGGENTRRITTVYPS